MLKKVLFLLLAIAILPFVGCGKPSLENEKPSLFTGYLVRKEYKPEGRCHDGRQTLSEASFIPLYSHHSSHYSHHSSMHHTIHRTRHHHKHQSATYTFYVANHLEIVRKSVTPEEYKKFKCGQKVTIFR